MANIYNIALRIYGGSVDGGLEKQPLVSVGSAPDAFQPTPPTLVDEQQAWMITHAQDFTCYATSFKSCRTLDDMPGQLLICLFFPPQKRLAEGRSPLELLDSLLDCFMLQALRGGRLPKSPVDSSPFSEILGNYRLEERPMQLPVMQGHDASAFCVENKTQLSAIMRHSRYSILSSVGRLELGLQCASTIQLMTQGATQKRTSKPESTTRKAEETHQDVKDVNVVSGGVDLDDGPIDPEPTPWFKKFMKTAAIIAAIVCGLFVIYNVLQDDEEPQKEQKAEIEEPTAVDPAVDIMTEPHRSLADTSRIVKKQAVNAQTSNDDSTLTDMVVVEDEEMNITEIEKKHELERKAELERRKAEELAKKKAEEEAAKKAESTKWQSSIQKHAQSCPIQLRLGVRITSITYTSSSVTYVVNYEELSKYDLDSTDRDNLSNDRMNVLKRYGAGLPTGVQVSIVQKDKAGRVL